MLRPSAVEAGSRSRERLVLKHPAQEVAQLRLLARAQTLEALARSSDLVEQPLAQPPPACREDDVLDPAVVGAELASHEPARLEAVDEAGHVRVVAAEEAREVAHGKRGLELEEGAGLRRMKVELGGSPEKAPALLGKERPQKQPNLGSGGIGRRVPIMDGTDHCLTFY